jgi:hypothetical protein
VCFLHTSTDLLHFFEPSNMGVLAEDPCTMSSSGDPPARNTCAAHARREEQCKAHQALPSEGQPQSDPGEAAVHIEATTSPRMSQLTSIAESHQEESGHTLEEC